MHIVFETERLLLRRFTADDAALIFGLNSDPEVIQYVHERPLESEADARQIITDIILPQYANDLGRWAIHKKEDGGFIGWCGLKFLAEENIIDLGYRLKKVAWGKGYATEAARHSINYGFNQLNIPLITGRAHIENLASIHVLEKLGMQYQGESIVDQCPVKTYTLARP